MRLRAVVALVGAMLALIAALPVHVGRATAGVVALPAARPAAGPIPGLVVRYLPAAAVRPGEPGAIRVVELDPTDPVADLIFLPGHADRADNHRDLFLAWAAAGLHVMSFDLPSHGQTTTRRIDAWNDPDLFAVVATLARSAGSPTRPLVLAGWSFGGLLTTRLLQDPAAMRSLGRRPAAAVLLVPAVTPQPFVGGDGIARTRSLTHDPAPPVAGPPHPVSPLLDPVFAVRLLVHAWQAREHPLPRSVPVLVVASDPGQDRYVNAAALLRWALRERAGGAPVAVLACTGARHAVDLEPWPVGPEVRSATVDFLTRTVPGVAVGARAALPPEGSPCSAR